MEITKEEYYEILQKQDKGEILLYIDTASFRQFFTTAYNIKTTELFGESLQMECVVINLISILELLSLLTTLVASIFLFKWFALLIAPALIAWALLRERGIGRQKIFFPLVLLTIGIIVSISYPEYGLWFKVFVMGLSTTYFSSKLLYYLSARFGFMLIHRNYKFFKLFYGELGKSPAPIIWSEKLK